MILNSQHTRYSVDNVPVSFICGFGGDFVGSIAGSRVDFAHTKNFLVISDCFGGHFCPSKLPGRAFGLHSQKSKIEVKHWCTQQSLSDHNTRHIPFSKRLFWFVRKNGAHGDLPDISYEVRCYLRAKSGFCDNVDCDVQ